MATSDGWRSSPGRVRNLLVPIASIPTLWFTHSLLVNGYRWLFRQGREAHHIATAAKVKNTWISTPTLSYAFITKFLIS
jgi:hypothetical protein